MRKGTGNSIGTQKAYRILKIQFIWISDTSQTNQNILIKLCIFHCSWIQLWHLRPFSACDITFEYLSWLLSRSVSYHTACEKHVNVITEFKITTNWREYAISDTANLNDPSTKPTAQKWGYFINQWDQTYETRPPITLLAGFSVSMLSGKFCNFFFFFLRRKCLPCHADR